MSRFCSRANFTKVKLCTTLAVIGKSSIFPITEQKGHDYNFLTFSIIHMPRLCSCANFTKVKLCTTLDVIGKSSILSIT